MVDNQAMQNLRNAQLLARLVLVWFVLFVGVSVASPLVNPQAGQMVCSAMGGMKMVATDDGLGDTAQAVNSLDCPLCVQVTLPTPSVSHHVDATSALAYVLRAIPSARIAWLTGAPLPPRGPPALP